MRIEQHIEIGEYRFRLVLESASIHAHSLMTDSRDIIQSNIRGTGDVMKGYPLKRLVEEREAKLNRR